MNLQQKINKILFALQKKGFYYRVNTINFYSEKLDKYCKKYELYIKYEFEEYNEREHKKEKKKKSIKILETFKQIDVLKYLIDDLKDYNSETGGDADVPEGTNRKTESVL